MAIRPVRLLGDPILRARCEPVKNTRSPAVRVVADDLQDTLRHLKEKHGVGRGLAASQIGAPMRIVYVETDEPHILINPEIVDIGTYDFLVWDDCFSIPDLLVHVQRAYHVKVTFSDLTGNKHTMEAEGELAELLQHEIDHLDGVLIVDRPVGLDPFCFRSEWETHYAAQGRCSDPVPRTLVPA
jgi:peptide deformylase